MLGGLMRANLLADPAKGDGLCRASGVVGIEVTDTKEDLTLSFRDGEVTVAAGRAHDPDLRLVGTADTVLGLSTVPLRFGLPDVLSGGGRMLTGRWVSGGLEIHGLPRGASLLRTTLTLLSVVA
jgi:hypothetical protein